MAPSHNVVLLVDVADLALKDRLKLLSLRLLNFLTCRAGLGQVRWSYRFLNSLGGRCRHPRRSDLRELGPRSWDDFEEELEACWEKSRSGRCSSTQSSRAALTHTALMETLSDFQWDRPDITSPTKPAVTRGRRGGRLMAVDEPAMQAESPSQTLASSGCRNAVFILSPCPHSRAQLGDFAAGGHDDIELQQVMDRLLPKRLQNIVHNKRVVLYWMDTSAWTQVLDSCDHFGYWTMVELMQLVGGRILPSESLLGSPGNNVTGGPFASGAAPMIPFDSVLGSLISNDLECKVQFPQQKGLVYLMTPGEEQWECAITLDPISVTQKYIKGLVTIHLKGTMQNWNWNQCDPLTLETWVLQDLSNCHAPCLPFQQLLRTTLSKGLLLVADVSTETSLVPRTGILSPISETSAVLNVVVGELSIGLDRLQDLQETEETSDHITSALPDIVNSVLNHVYSGDEPKTSPDVPTVEWIKQELSQSNHWSSSVIEKWYPLSGTSGATSNLMESFRLINAASFEHDEQKYDQEITNYLSDFYQKKSSDESGGVVQGDIQKKRLPRTPVRQKMKTMPRALQMLNTARLNLKAQKSQPEGGPGAAGEKAKRRSSEKPEEKKPKKQTGFKSEEELVSFLTEDYDKTVSGEDDALLSCVRNALSTIKTYLKSVASKQMEVDCILTIKRLLKTSKIIRQLYGQNLNTKAKLRECRLQALIRLEMCVQCSSIQSNEDEMEQVVEEITDMLRIISLTEDPSFLTKFLADVLAEYIGSIPRILADVYFSLGTQIPKELALVLPADGEDCLLYEGKTPMYSQPSISRVPSLPQIGNEEDQLEELRTRSAKKRRTSTMTRHRSIAESSQTMRQIELPKKLMNREGSNANLVVMVEKLKLPLQAQPQPQKEAEATKVRRNLFVQENRSPTRRGSKMPRSQSVSAVEELKHKRSKSHDGTKDHYKLLTKKVTETPVHKQLANRLIHKQIKGRQSESTCNISVVEESPEKDINELDLRRSPRIKQMSLTRRNSSFYASQPMSRNLERVHLAAQQLPSGAPKGNANSSEKKSPKRLLFGEVLQQTSPPTRRARRRLLNDTDHIATQITGKCQRKTPRKTPQKSFPNCVEPVEKNMLPRKSPCTPRTPRTLKTPSKSPGERRSAAKNLGKIFSPSKLEEKSPVRFSESKSERLAEITPRKRMPSDNCFISPSKSPRQPFTPQKESSLRTPKSVLKTPTTAKQRTQLSCTPRKSPRLHSPSTECFTPSRYQLRTPQKFVPQTPTPKKSDRKHSVLSCLTECTPKKQKLSSPRRQAAEGYSMSPNRISPCFKKSILGLSSIAQCQSTHATPRKSHLVNDFEPGSTQVTADQCEVLKDARHFTEVASVTKNIPPVTTSILPKNVHVSSEGLPPERKLSSNILSPKGDLIVLCEKLDVSSLESSEDSESFAVTSHTDESIEISEAKVVPVESSALKMKFLITRKSSDTSLMNHLPSTPSNDGKVQCSSPYGLRHTVDRRQREAAARLQSPQIPAKFSTPKSQKKKNEPPPVYEVQLEMQDSGLPKLRFKRTDSNQTVDLGSQSRVEESPMVSRNRKGNESPFGESWCNRHAMKLEASPYRRSCHNTPGKIQAFICQSYTPSRCSSTASPIQADPAGPWTPSPKYNDKNASDLINNWPRKKKATAVTVANIPVGGKKPDTSSAPSTDEGSLEQEVNKLSPLEELMLDGGISKLECSPVIELIGKTEAETNVFKCKKRCFDLVSPTKETLSAAKRSCTFASTYEVKEDCVVSSSQSSNLNSSQDSVCEDEVFTISGFTPPNKVLKNSLSASGLLSLTQSPMLFKGRTPSSKRKLQDGESQHSTPEMKRAAAPSNLDDSPFSSTAPRRTMSRTYTRKKLIT